MIVFVTLGAWGLSKLNQGRFDDRERVRKHFEALDREAEVKERRKRKPKLEFNMEEELAKLEKEVDLSNWEPKRINRKPED